MPSLASEREENLNRLRKEPITVVRLAKFIQRNCKSSTLDTKTFFRLQDMAKVALEQETQGEERGRE